MEIVMKLFVSAAAMVLFFSIMPLTWFISPAFAQEAGTDVRVVTMQVRADDPSIGDVIEVQVTVVNFASSTVDRILELAVGGIVVDSQSIQLAPEQSKDVLFSFKASKEGLETVAVGNVEQTVTITGEQNDAKMRVGVTVRLQATKTVVTKNEDALIDVYWDNSELNEKEVRIELLIQVPTGLYLYSEIGAMACSAGTCKGMFNAPPGSVRNMPITVKADAVGDYFLNLNGRYWPEGDPDAWQPVNLTTPIYVRETSGNLTGPTKIEITSTTAPSTSAPGTLPAQQVPAPAQTSAPPEENETRWWLESQALVLWLIIALVVIAVAAFLAFSKSSINIGAD